ncbi:unnamed protein product [Phytomonas sp. Hart1]|nr:unnamed protein product [Phytomonas sp. Hart1]|eukprot:CCW71489.1 unnamed protein product [Phytomonas sp. isolate Hart1]
MLKNDQIFDVLLNLKYTSKQLTKHSNKAENASEKEMNNIKKAIEKGNTEAARIYAVNSIRKRNESLDYLRLASRIDATASRIQSAIKINETVKLMKNTVKGMDIIMESLDPVKITRLMDKFEKQAGILEVNTSTMNAAFESTSEGAIPVDQVDTLLEQIATENNIDISTKMSNGPLNSILHEHISASQEAEDDIERRLKALQSL